MSQHERCQHCGEGHMAGCPQLDRLSKLEAVAEAARSYLLAVDHLGDAHPTSIGYGPAVDAKLAAYDALEGAVNALDEREEQQ